ncbi:putative motility protein [Zoogloea sp. LCSB751]|uniref:putative motility protein n=1 Tax=Zoogloea sp. LCSB751 TaxID=1965277 RepID=UPI0009A4E235|nr:YjfB family protein [Zoogloea sp. LCSB751]
MSVSALASTSQVQTQDSVSVLMLRKVLDQQQQSAAQMLEALPRPVAAPDPAATVGRTIDTFA